MKKRIICILIIAILMLTGCAGVEPERRAFPQVISIDCLEDQYLVSFGMANLPEQTGQQKSDPEADTGLVRIYKGANMDDVIRQYNKSQEYYLDWGHVQVVIFGSGILRNQQALQQMLGVLEDNVLIGENAYAFSAENPEDIMKVNGTSVESLSNYLVGIYKNRPVPQEKKMLTLKQMFYAWHNEDKTLIPPEIMLEGGIPTIPSVVDEDSG